MDNLLFTPSSILDMLINIQELEDYEIQMTEKIDGDIELTIGDNTYTIHPEDAEEIKVDNEVVDLVEKVNEDAYLDLEQNQEIQYTSDSQDLLEPVKSGLLKTAIKSLMLGGMIRLSKKLLD